VTVHNPSVVDNNVEFQQGGSWNPGANSAPDVQDLSEVDDDTFTVNEGSITLDNPQGTYVVGSEVNVNGSTAPGIDDVALYARDEGNFEHFLTVSVDGDDTFEEEDAILSQLSNVLSLPGSYRIAAVDADDEAVQAVGDESGENTVDPTDPDVTLEASLTASEVSSAVGTQSSLRVTDTGLTVDYVSIVNGQVAVEDAQTGMTINGTAPGKDSVSVSFYGPRGTYDRTTITVDSNGEFESESVMVGNNLALTGVDEQGNPAGQLDTGLTQGNVVMSVFSDGRDSTAGDGDISFPTDYVAANGGDSQDGWYAYLNDQALTQQQLIDRVASEPVEDTGSDDISEVFQFRYTEGRVSIDSVTGEAGQAFTVETNDTISVSGVTNRQPDDTTIMVEVIEGPSASSPDIASTDAWGTDGQWSVEIPTEGVETGNYTVEASVGGNSDIRSFQVTGEQLEEPTEPEPTDTATEPEPDPEPTETTEEPEPTTDEPEPTTAAGTEPAEETTTATGPGFTAVLALVALVAAALLAVRRRD